MAKKRLDILLEDEDFIAVDKPSGLLSIADRAQNESLKSLLDQMYGTVYIVHRLDKDTSGVILFAKNKDAHQYLCQQFETRLVEKYYVAIVSGSPAEEEGLIEAPIAVHPTLKGAMQVHRNGKPSQTGYRILEKNDYFSLVEFQLFTGRMHQIRVHARHAGCPIVVDELYGDAAPIFLSKYKRNYKLSRAEDAERPMIDRLALHAARIVFTNRRGETVTVTSNTPKPFLALMKQLKK
ncbi:MAG TPA: RluA family pseudouridine synthase [Ferruginibacter sp.]|nr:RluA family pseudouridine synthase [Ferruginibacter sp.]HRO17578.1 RluA family pseudouridine synthase [Ferruginibacter sp.]HRQ21757.1 RluA family pseudouridine synthase [Ferruginibacter sp.]